MDTQSLFLEEVREQLQEFSAALLELDADHGDKSVVDRIFRAVHTIKGACSMFGQEDIVSLAHDVETIFDNIRKNTLEVTRELINLSLVAQDQMILMLENDGDQIDEEKTLKVLSGLQALLEKPRSLSVSFSEYEENTSSNESKASAISSPAKHDATPEETPLLHESRAATYYIRLDLTGPQSLEFIDAQSILDELRMLGKSVVFADDTQLPLLDVLQLHDGYLVWHVFLVTEQDKSAIEDCLFFIEQGQFHLECVDSKGRLPDAVLHSAICAFLNQHEVLTERNYEELLNLEPPSVTFSLSTDDNEIESAIPPAVPETPAPVSAKSTTKSAATPAEKSTPLSVPSPPAATRSQAALSIRVDASKLDNLVNLVGELVIAQARLNQIAVSLAHPQLLSVAEEIEHLSNELRDNTLSVRMLPIGTTFSRFRRLVRDLSAELNKEIELVTEGGDTELDKTVIDQLNDPLVHLLRNSIDHGIEAPDVRVSSGKPAQGSIRLSAEHIGGEVVVRIIDDGKGLDVQKIRDRAIEKGLINSEARLKDTEIYSLIFLPGFSTAERVTSVSGRGVGMDVVKRSMDALRGKIEIDSKVGVGTTLTIKLPLTLAIIDGLQIRADNEIYIIPLPIVEECVELTADEYRRDTRNRTLHLRGELIPYLRLREVFSLEPTPPPIEQVVIARYGQNRIGIAVDEVLGQQQTVIKSLGRAIGNVDGISGATVNGDGSMSLILDIQTLVAVIREHSAL